MTMIPSKLPPAGFQPSEKLEAPKSKQENLTKSTLSSSNTEGSKSQKPSCYTRVCSKIKSFLCTIWYCISFQWLCKKKPASVTQTASKTVTTPASASKTEQKTNTQESTKNKQETTEPGTSPTATSKTEQKANKQETIPATISKTEEKQKAKDLLKDNQQPTGTGTKTSQTIANANGSSSKTQEKPKQAASKDKTDKKKPDLKKFNSLPSAVRTPLAPQKAPSKNASFGKFLTPNTEEFLRAKAQECFDERVAEGFPFTDETQDKLLAFLRSNPKDHDYTFLAFQTVSKAWLKTSKDLLEQDLAELASVLASKNPQKIEDLPQEQLTLLDDSAIRLLITICQCCYNSCDLIPQSKLAANTGFQKVYEKFTITKDGIDYLPHQAVLLDCADVLRTSFEALDKLKSKYKILEQTSFAYTYELFKRRWQHDFSQIYLQHPSQITHEDAKDRPGILHSWDTFFHFTEEEMKTRAHLQDKIPIIVKPAHGQN